MKDFSTLGLPRTLLNCLERMNFKTPTPIQAQAIPVALKGRDILGSAQTGTGKTAAFGIPLIERLMTTEQTTALIMTPTRELATQVLKALREMIPADAGIRSALLIGGDSMSKQLNQLKGYPRLIVGTPGRINDHLERKSLKLRDAGFLVLDETDRMLDMGFGVQIDRILRHMPKERQTLLFSATLPPEIVQISKKYLHMPERIAVGETHTPIANIKQEMVKVNTADKYKTLLQHLSVRTGSVIVFVKTKHGADRMATRLNREGHSAEAIHGDLKQSKRDRVIADFRAKEHRILVATDVAARGLDIPHIEHVINYDLPQVAEDYIHRIGRTARAGKTGEAVCFVSPEDGAKWKAIYLLMNPSEKSLKNDDRAEADLMRRKPAGNKGSGKPRRSSDGKSFGARDFAERRISGKRKPEDRDGRYEERNDDRSASKKPFRKKAADGGKPFGAKSFGDKPFGDRPFGDKPFSDKPRSDKPRTGKFSGGKKAPGGKPANGKSAVGKSSLGDRPRGKPAGGKMGKFARQNARRRAAA
ncbi:MAG TPA: DEAD/DEAH box helicase [Alphaproteobacteria bacterium]|nr:DEAD/DEAH box helicase [Alphaproteobacteria bacterium]